MFKGFYDASVRPPLPCKCEPKTLQREWEIAALLDILQERQPRNVLEIGSAEGGTLRLFMQTLDPGAQFVSIDLEFRESAGRRWAEKYGHTLNVLNGPSQSPEIDVLATQIMPTIDFLFIDGDHSYEQVRHDFESYGWHVPPGGLIGLHDILFTPDDPAVEVHRLWTDIREAGYITQELITGRDNGPGGIGLVYI